MEAERILEGLNPAQRDAVTSSAAPLRILAGAGSGKTRVLTRRIAYRCVTGDADPRHVLALTFTRKAAGELHHRLSQLGLRHRPAAGTFHAIAYAQLRRRWDDERRQAPRLLERKGRLLARFVPRRPGLDVTAADLAVEIEWAQARMFAPDAYPAAASAASRRAPLPYGEMARIYESYEQQKRRDRLVDFDDLLGLCADAIESDSDFAAAQRWQFRHFFVDEFQDVNPLQLRLLDAWRGGRSDLCVVGDPNQAIYSWNGADPNLIVNFADRHPGSGTVVLAENYRSTPQVLAVANAVLTAGGPAPAGAATRLRAVRSEGPIPTVHSYSSDVDEARAIARAARDLHGPNRPWSHQAVLTRTHAQGVVIETAFRALGIPTRRRGSARFVELPEIKDALRALRTSHRSFREALADVEVALGDDESDESDDPDTEAALPEAVVARHDNVRALLTLGGDYCDGTSEPTSAGFVDWLAATLDSDGRDGPADAVEIGTFHAAKGLEWPVVHLAGLESGLVPIGLAKTAAAEAEERRLFYVAITRAVDILRGSWAETRTFGNRTAKRSASPYLNEVEQVLAALRAGTAPDDWRPHVARQREQLSKRARGPGSLVTGAAPLEGKAAELFGELKKWRAQAARSADVPAYVIFHDTTLEAVARHRPSNECVLLSMPGVGPVKASRFGAQVLKVVAEHGAT